MPSTLTVTGNLQLASGSADASGTVDFEIKGYGSNVPRVLGTSTIVTPKVTATDSGSGFSQAIWGNDNVDPAGTIYLVTFKNDLGVQVGQYSFNFTGAGPINLNSATPVTVSPIVTPPTGDTTYARKDAGNLPFTGQVGAPSFSSAEGSAPVGAAGSDILWGDSSAHRWKMINNNGSADTVVGAATTDTLTNKTLYGASSGNAVTLLNEQGPASAIVGTGADATLYTYTIPANTIGAGKGIRIKVKFIHSTGTAAPTFKLTFGATTIDSPAYGNNNTSAIDCYTYEVFNNTGVQNAQNWGSEKLINISTFVTGLLGNAATGTSAIDFTQSQVLKFTFNVAATDQITPKMWLVELIQ